MFRKLPDHADAAVTVFIDGAPVAAHVGEPVAAVLLREARPWAHELAVSGERRAPFCMMGVCFDCLATVDGVGSVQTCLTEISDGMQIQRQTGRRDMPEGAA